MVIIKNWGGHFVLRALHPKSWGHVHPPPAPVSAAHACNTLRPFADFPKASFAKTFNISFFIE